jgi:hypothetical protein
MSGHGGNEFGLVHLLFPLPERAESFAQDPLAANSMFRILALFPLSQQRGTVDFTLANKKFRVREREDSWLSLFSMSCILVPARRFSRGSRPIWA